MGRERGWSGTVTTEMYYEIVYTVTAGYTSGSSWSMTRSKLEQINTMATVEPPATASMSDGLAAVNTIELPASGQTFIPGIELETIKFMVYMTFQWDFDSLS